jgi:DNA mismatch endonuclease (patch repair protein)
MADVVDRATRSRMMSGIRGRNTKPELTVRSFLHRQGLRFRIHGRQLPGRPDVVLPKYRVALFVHGCFWHRHSGCQYASTPKNNAAFWRAKLDGNALRDKRHRRELARLGWRVFTVWECELDEQRLLRLVRRIQDDAR